MRPRHTKPRLDVAMPNLRSRTGLSVSMCGGFQSLTPLPNSNSVEDLGLTCKHKLRFDVYILKIVSRALQMIGLIFRSSVSRDMHIYLLVLFQHNRMSVQYSNIVHPALIWSPRLLNCITMIKNIYFTCHKVGRYRDMDDINKCFGGLNLLELFNLFRKIILE